MQTVLGKNLAFVVYTLIVIERAKSLFSYDLVRSLYSLSSLNVQNDSSLQLKWSSLSQSPLKEF